VIVCIPRGKQGFGRLGSQPRPAYRMTALRVESQGRITFRRCHQTKSRIPFQCNKFSAFRPTIACPWDDICEHAQFLKNRIVC
jgi:hypothetical protein